MPTTTTTMSPNHPDDLPIWARLALAKNMGSIRDEYDRPYPLDEFRLIADRTEDGHGEPLKARYGDRASDQLRNREYIDPDGHAFYNGDFC
ncbi:hypothetical protein OG455_41545 [Kitasatospora sp. NBC_01287]|uniref:hypothetical protein n=1 Tax=Kitasatospora sp. NBC_01287 TaxID=2903573 RepID=UPI002258A7DA|nr:hypothetical protein [Kitasatospora sp. NBC_01287]MCX4750969.1 hypothetical protein [Kitasatospora sp. NBC_01287]MCX4751780.1 hypothetical protein [Kitasatospora sp. NBC_01287]MCX4751928.1 hypothetical protein [Kitasatospora sp. NBC_01287]